MKTRGKIYRCKKKKSRTKKSRTKKMRGGHKPISFDDIMESIVATKSEYCGYLENGQHFLTHIGEPKETPEQRGTCIPPKRHTIWHTHTTQSKYYPSLEDIHKVFKHVSIQESVIYTVYGYWLMNYSGEAIILPDNVLAHINELLDHFYRNTHRGRDYNQVTIDNLTHQLNAFLPGFNIRWGDYPE